MSDKALHNRLNDENLKKSIFKAPEGYFESFEEKIKARIETENSPLLSDPHLKQNVFTTPEGYFNQLQSKINEQVKEETKVIPIFRQQWVRYAAAVLLLVAAYFALPEKMNDEEKALAGLSDDAIISYLEEQQALQYDMLSSAEGLDNALEIILTDEASNFSMALNDNPELEYDFEYYDY